jgi:hypothetical protein
MFKWRSKLLFMLVVYFAGFATAVYFLAPVDEDMTASVNSDESYIHRQFDTEKFAKTTSVRLHEFISFAGDKASGVSELLKEKLAQSRSGKQ